MPKLQCLCLAAPAALILILMAILSCGTATKFSIPKPRIVISKEIKDRFNAISNAEWQEFVRIGVESINKQKRLEANLLSSRITVDNGSISHAQLIDTLPNNEAKYDMDVAMKILKSSLYVYNSKCLQNGLTGEECLMLLESKSLPQGTDLLQACRQVLDGRRDGHHAFRRLLPRYYKDGIHAMFTEDRLPLARLISRNAYDAEQRAGMGINNVINTDELDDNYRNLALVQWSQFIEHDLSKPVAVSMNDGTPIECCNRNHQKLQPRFHHPACEPLLLGDEHNKNGRPSCLNYVRSGLAVSDRCSFGAAEKLNQATGTLDLSQLYGFSDATNFKMRAFKNGQLKSSGSENPQSVLLPMTTNAEGHAFCAIKSGDNVSACFMAGDSRVNSNPFSILINTIFLRNHNQIAKRLMDKFPRWNDDQLFEAAKAINVDIYRRIIMNEWLPIVLGEQTAAELESYPKINTDHDLGISNEFAVAAIRFHLSMMANSLHNLAGNADSELPDTNNTIPPTENLFELKEEIYKPHIAYSDTKLNEILESLLQQRAMKMDASYVGSLIWHGPASVRPTHADVLAFDIQRGRDHGLQPYAKYLEACTDIKINGWLDFESFMSKKNVDQLKSLYNSWSDVDLIVGGISERPLSNSTVGVTFNCILAEQFVRIHQRHQALNTELVENNFRQLSGVDLLCLNSDLKFVQKNIFQLSSESNPMVNCADRLKILFTTTR